MASRYSVLDKKRGRLGTAAILMKKTANTWKKYSAMKVEKKISQGAKFGFDTM